MSAASDEVYSESVRIESKVIYADLRANARGQYLKLSETGAKRLRSTVLLPGPSVKWVYSLLDYYVRECAAGNQPANKELAVDNKVFQFSAGSNDRGRFLRISEAGASHAPGRHTLVIPSGGPDLTGWVVLRDCIRRVAAIAEGEPAPASDSPGGSGAGGSGGAPAARAHDVPLLDVSAAPVVGPGHPPPALGASAQGTPVLHVHGKRVYFDVGASPRGAYMRITEVARQDRSSIVIPAVAVPQFRAAVDTCAELLERQPAAGASPPPAQGAPPPPQGAPPPQRRPR